MENVFKSTILQSDFDAKGYVQIPLLQQDDIGALMEVFLQHQLEYGQPFHTSHFSNAAEYKRHVNQAVIDIVFPRLAPVLQNCLPIFGNLMIKQSNSEYFMPLHADWTYVDENKFRSLAVWVALVDTDETNGCLGVIEGSHKVMGKIRGPRIQVSTYQHDKDWVKNFGKLLPSKAGYAIIYDHALMHYSPANKSSQPRPALNLSVVPADADIIHYCIPEGATEIEEYKVADSEFYLKYNNFQRPETNSLIRTLPANVITMVDEKMKNFEPVKKKSFLSRIFG